MTCITKGDKGDNVPFDFTFTENLLFARSITAVLQGGYDDTFTAATGTTVVNGKMSISNGKVKVGGSVRLH